MKIILQQGHIESGGTSSPQGTLDDLRSWVKSFAPRQCNPTDLKAIAGNLSRGSLTHSGLIYYLHACWAKELGCVLRPDMIYFTILSEVASSVLDHPKDFQPLMTKSQQKENIIVVDPRADQGMLSIRSLCAKLKSAVVSKELYQMVCETKFASDDAHAHEVRCMAFCQMGIPYFNYLSTFCGIQSIDLRGDLTDWTKLLTTISNLETLLSKYDSSGEVTHLLKQSSLTVSSIIHFAFNPRFQVDPKYTNTSVNEFFNDIFHYGHNSKCGSGHDTNIVSGWVRNFYKSQREDLHNFSTSMTYVPYHNIETERNFIQVATLAYSDLVNGVAVPHYGKIIFEVLNEELFNKIAMKKAGGDNLDFLF